MRMGRHAQHEGAPGSFHAITDRTERTVARAPTTPVASRGDPRGDPSHRMPDEVHGCRISLIEGQGTGPVMPPSGGPDRAHDTTAVTCRATSILDQRMRVRTSSQLESSRVAQWRRGSACRTRSQCQNCCRSVRNGYDVAPPSRPTTGRRSSCRCRGFVPGTSACR